MMALNQEYRDKLLIAERLAMIEATSLPYQDPFEPLKPTAAWKVLRSGSMLLLIVLVLGLLTVLGTLY